MQDDAKQDGEHDNGQDPLLILSAEVVDDERIIIGLGAGRSQIEAHAQIYEGIYGCTIPIESMTGMAKSSLMPGAAETMGIGAIGSHLLVSTAVTAVS